jgi:thioredoxin reductase (NADPH)
MDPIDPSVNPLKPVILAQCGLPDRRRMVERELGRRYAQDYDVLFASSPGQAAAMLEALSANDRAVALLLADDATPVDGATTLFAYARHRFPDVRRGLLIEWGAWADRECAASVLHLMATGQIDYHVIRPWRGPDEYFHRTVTEFLLEWERASGSRPHEVTLVGSPRSARVHDLRSLLARGGVPHSFVPAESAEGHRLLVQNDVRDDVPMVLLHDGRVLSDPTNSELVHAYGVDTEVPAVVECDVVVVGAGPAGLSAAVYAASEGLSVLVLEYEAIGGQAGSSSLIRNYLGFARGISGAELAQRAYQQAWVFGASFAHTREAVGLNPQGDRLIIDVAPDRRVHAKAVVLATGVTYRRLGVPELEELSGAGVFYGASVVEAQALRDRVAHVVGGGNSAGQAALHLARYARSVSLLVRGESLAESMSRYLIDALAAAGVQVRLGVEVVGGGGHGTLEHIRLRDRGTGAETTEASDGLFVLIGAEPRTSWLPDTLLRDRWGYVLTGEEMLAEGGRRAWPLDRPPRPHEASIPGVFAVGDVRRGSVKRVASAVGEGSVVISEGHAHIGDRAIPSLAPVGAPPGR